MGELAQLDPVLTAEALETLPTVDQVALLVEEYEDGWATAIDGTGTEDLYI